MDDSVGDSIAQTKERANRLASPITKAIPKIPVVILNVCETAQGGVGRYQDTLCSLSEYGFSCHVLLPKADIGILNDPQNATTFSRPRRGLQAIFHLLRRFLSERRRLKPDLYFFHSTFALIPLLILRLHGDKTPSVYCAHCWAANSSDTETLKKKMIRLIEGRLCGLADLIVNVSQSDADMAAKYRYRGRHIVIENAVPESSVRHVQEKFPRPSDKTINLLYVGRFDRQKGLDVLLKAFAQARTRNPDLTLHLVGEPVRADEMPDLPGGVTHHGWTQPDQIDLFYASADALVVPSRWEGLPLVIPEAYRNGSPVLAARRSGMQYLLEEGVTGYSFDLNASSLASLLSDLDRTQLLKMRPDARALYEQRFQIDRFARTMATHLQGLLEHSRQEPMQ